MIDQLIVIFNSLFATSVYAQSGSIGGSLTKNPPTLDQLFTSFEKPLDYLFPIAVLIAVIMIVYGGYMWIVSGGDPNKKQMAQGTLTWAILGLIFIFLIRMLLTFVLDLIGI